MILLWNVYLVPHKSCVWGLEISPTDTLPIALAKQGPCVLDGSCPSGTCFQSRNLKSAVAGDLDLVCTVADWSQIRILTAPLRPHWKMDALVVCNLPFHHATWWWLLAVYRAVNWWPTVFNIRHSSDRFRWSNLVLKCSDLNLVS